jgi:hypothetical protein
VRGLRIRPAAGLRGLNAIAPKVDEVLNEQIARFKSYVEKKDPAAK